MAEYYQYNDIVIRFDVFKDGAAETPNSALVLVYDSDKEYLGKDMAKVAGNEIRYILKGNKVQKVGKYYFVFKARIKQLGDYTHIVKVNVKELPVPVNR